MKKYKNILLKGGIAGTAIALASILLSQLCIYTGGVMACVLILIPVLPAYSLVNDMTSSPPSMIVYWLVSVLAWFVIGAFLSTLGVYLDSRRNNK